MAAVGSSGRSLPVFRVMADDLRTRILDGTYAEGERLPSESELLAHYGTARMTVRQAIEVLRSEGLVVTVQGKGAFVRTRPQTRLLRADRFARGRGGRGTARGASETDVTVHLLDLSKDKATPEEADQLRLRKGQLVLRRQVSRHAPDGPLEVATDVVSAALARGTALEQPDRAETGLYELLAEAGHAPRRLTEQLTARMPSPAEQELLRLSPGTPVLRSVRTAVDASGRPLAVTTTVLAADRHVLEQDLTL